VTWWWDEGRVLSQKWTVRVQQRGAALPSLGQLPGCQGSPIRQVGGELAPFALRII